MTNISGFNGKTIGGTMYDMPPVGKVLSLIAGGTKIAKSGSITVSLGSYLPKDDHDYEVTLMVHGWTNNVAWAYAYMSINISGAYSVHGANTRTTTTVSQNAAILLRAVVKANNRNLIFTNTNSSEILGIDVWAVNYKKLGKAQDTAKPIQKLVSPAGEDNISGVNTQYNTWTLLNKALIDQVSLAPQENSVAGRSIDVSSYLPNDGYNYEVLVTVRAWPASATQGISTSIRVGSDYMGDKPIICRVNNTTAYAELCGGNAVLAVDTSRKLEVKNVGSGGNSTVDVNLHGYRRIGKNSASGTLLDKCCIATESLTPCGIIYGNPTTTNGIMSGFSANNYVDVPGGRRDNSEFVFAFTLPSLPTKDESIFHTENWFCLEYYSTDNSIGFYNWEEGATGKILTPQAGQKYWIKAVVNGTSRTYSYSTDGINYTGEVSSSDTGVDLSLDYPARLGNCTSLNLISTRGFSGEIDLNECYIKDLSTGKIIWQGMDYKRYMPIYGDFTSGAFTVKDRAVFNNVTFAANSNTVYTISDYLPKDNHQYEILFTGYGYTGGTKGNSNTGWLLPNGSWNGAQISSYTRTPANGPVANAKCGLYIANNNNGSFNFTYNCSNATTGVMQLRFVGYRRVGMG